MIDRIGEIIFERSAVIGVEAADIRDLNRSREILVAIEDV
jgi:hypothetical protein